MKNLYDYEDTQSATVDLPFGAFKNESAPGKQDGTAIVAEHIQDIVYPLYQILQLAGITPDGELEDGNSKTQFIQALTNIGIFRYSDKSIYNKSVFVWNVIGSVFTLYRSAKDNNNADINDETSWIKILELGSDNKINFYVDTNIYGDYLNKDLSDLSSVGIDKINQSKALETGAVSSDADVYADIQKYAHSTFDRSKFEVVGSPVITDDGIASGFTHSNYVLFSLSLNNTQKIVHYSKYVFKNASRTQVLWSFYATRLELNATTVSFKWNNTNILIENFKNTLQDDDIIEIFFILNDNGQNKLIAKVNGEESINITNSTSLAEHSLASIRIGDYVQIDNLYFTGSIDLKSFAFWADGVPVFNGNKTGLYIAKPDNYEVVGSPTISEDGVASGFSNNNYPYITLPKSGNNIKLMISGVYGSNGNILGFYEGSNTLDLSPTYVRSYINGKTLITNIGGTFNIGDYYKIEAVWSNGKQSQTVTTKYGTYTTTSSYPFAFPTNLQLNIGAGNKGLYGITAGSIDLNSIKTYIDVELVAQPCLKIPYTESKTGSKIVDVAYRDRVQDLYEQTGEALFYTLDEENQNFTLPMGEIYGMISKNEEILDVIYPIGRPMQEINNELLDNEIWLEGATVSRTDYANLFNVYGTTYGEGDGSTTFQLPDLRDRVLWGSPDGSNGYIEAALPNIKGKTGYGGPSGETNSGRINGAFYNSGSYSGWTFGGNNSRDSGVSFSASRSSSIYSDNATTVQPPAFKVRWKTRFK